MAGNNNVVIDLTNYKDTFGTRVPPGDYTVVVEDAQHGKSARKGTPQITLWFRVNGGEEDGSTILDNLYLTENSLFRVVAFMQALGIKTPRKKLAVDISKFIGRQLVITVDDGEPYNGRTKSEVRGYMKATGSADEVTDLEVPDDDEDDVEEIDEDATEEKPKKKAKKSKAPDEEDDEPEVLDLDEIDL